MSPREWTGTRMSRPLAGVLSLFLVLAAAELAVSHWLEERRPRNPAQTERAFTLRVEGLRTSIQKKGARYVLASDELIIRPVKFFVFSINPYDELILKNLRIDSFRETAAQPSEPLKFGEVFPDSKETVFPFLNTQRAISSGSIEKFTYRAYLEGAEKGVLSSERGEIDFAKRQLRLGRTTITRGSETLRFERGIWKAQDNRVYIEGDCLKITPEGVTVLRKIRVGM
jgi:hypothetical protein